MTQRLLWRKAPNWYLGFNIGLRNKVGLFRVTLHDEIVFIGQASDGLANRMTALSKPKKTRKRDDGEQKIYEHRKIVIMWVAEVDLGAVELTRLRNALIRKHRPAWVRRISTPRGLGHIGDL